MKETKSEVHPFEAYIPANTNYLLLGSFPCKNKEGDYGQWFYCGSGKSLFWSLLEKVYQTDLQSISAKKQLFQTFGIAITDIAKEIQRKSEDRKLFCKDLNLDIVKFNTDEISKIIEKKTIKRIYFTSQYVENVFRKQIEPIISVKNIKTITLLSPSPIAALAYSTRQDVMEFLKEQPGKRIKDFIFNQYKTELPTNPA